MGDLTLRLIEYELPPNRLPLCADRFPFRKLPADTVSTIAQRALSTPELRGRLTDSVRELAGVTAPTFGEFSVFEAHIDLTELDADLSLALIELGFEPDDFAKMEPEEYRHHFTLQFVVPMSSSGLTAFQRQVVDAGRRAMDLIDNHSGTTGYVEIETYRSRYMCRLPDADVSLDMCRRPALSSHFEIRNVPASSAEAEASGLPLEIRRAADIHVKVPGRFPGYDGTLPAVRLRRAEGNCPSGRARIKAVLEAEGFYEIVSHAGNFLYSAHFADLAEANHAYWELVGYARECGGITGVVREVCTDVWRTSTESIAGGEVYAHVPPLLRRSWRVSGG